MFFEVLIVAGLEITGKDCGLEKGTLCGVRILLKVI